MSWFSYNSFDDFEILDNKDVYVLVLQGNLIEYYDRNGDIDDFSMEIIRLKINSPSRKFWKLEVYIYLTQTFGLSSNEAKNLIKEMKLY